MKDVFFVHSRFVVLSLLIFYVDYGSTENPRRRRFYKDAQFSAVQNFSILHDVILTVLVKNSVDCVHACVGHPQCVSVNYNTLGNPDHLCELCNQTLGKTKQGNWISRSGYIHLRPILTSCSESPCKNGGTCAYLYDNRWGAVVDYRCECYPYTSGRHCEIGPFTSCQDIVNKTGNHELEDGAYALLLDNALVYVRCQLKNISGCGPKGGWTLVIKADPYKPTFSYQSSYWSNKIAYNSPAGKTGFDNSETKLPAYWTVPFEEVCVGFKVAENIQFTTIPFKATSLYDVIADGVERRFAIGRASWKALIQGSSLQLDCNFEGFNVRAPKGKSVRIGIIADNSDSSPPCSGLPDSFLGFAQYKFPFSYQHGNMCGYMAKYCDTKTLEKIPAYGYILVR